MSDKINQAAVPTIIPPTNGRVVLFTPGKDFPGVWHDPSQKLAATVCHVWGPRMVNLVVTDSNGVQHPQTSVDLLQPGDDPAIYDMHRRFAEWMPFQIGQAKRA